MKTVAV